MNEEPKRKVFSLYANERKERLNHILIKLSKHTNTINLSRLIGQLAFQWGLRTRRVEEYFEQLKIAGLVIINSEWEMGVENRTVKITKAGKEEIATTESR